MSSFHKDLQYRKFALYGFLKNIQLFDPFLILFLREMGISFFQIGILYSVREIVSNISEIPSGVIADSLGRRSSMVFAFIAYIISFLVFYFFPSFSSYVLAMVAFGLGESFRSGTHKAMIMEYLRQRGMSGAKVQYYGHTRAWAQRGSALNALIAAALVFFSGSYRVLFLWSILPYIAGGLLIISYPKELDFSREEGKESSEAPLDTMKRTVLDFFAMFRDPAVRRSLLNSSLFDAAFKTVKDYIQPVLRAFALSLPVLALAQGGKERSAVLMGVVYAILYIISGEASRHSSSFEAKFSSPVRSLNSTYLLGGLSIAAVGIGMIAGLEAAAVLFFVIYYVIENLRRPSALAVLSNRIRSSVMATGLSGESQMKTLLVALFAPLFGLIGDQFGIGFAFVSFACIPLLAYPFLRFRD